MARDFPQIHRALSGDLAELLKLDDWTLIVTTVATEIALLVKAKSLSLPVELHITSGIEEPLYSGIFEANGKPLVRCLQPDESKWHSLAFPASAIKRAASSRLSWEDSYERGTQRDYCRMVEL